MTIDKAQAKHKSFVDDVTKLRDKRDKALDVLIRTELRYRNAVRAVARSQKRLNKAREEERQSKKAQKKATAESKKELPTITV